MQERQIPNPNRSKIKFSFSSEFFVNFSLGCAAKTKGDKGSIACCHFPFTYKGKTYNKCTNKDHNQLWCGTTADASKWDNCVTGKIVSDTY